MEKRILAEKTTFVDRNASCMRWMYTSHRGLNTRSEHEISNKIVLTFRYLR